MICIYYKDIVEVHSLRHIEVGWMTAATEIQNDAPWKQQHLIVTAGNNLPATSSGAVAAAHGQEQEAAPGM
jgi:hypothetical protein